MRGTEGDHLDEFFWEDDNFPRLYGSGYNAFSVCQGSPTAEQRQLNFGQAPRSSKSSKRKIADTSMSRPRRGAPDAFETDEILPSIQDARERGWGDRWLRLSIVPGLGASTATFAAELGVGPMRRSQRAEEEHPILRKHQKSW
jgi:hypothetical protein